MRHTFRSERWFPCPVEFVFAFFANPQNLSRLMPAWQKARIVETTLAPPPPRPIPSNPSLQLNTLAAGIGSHLKISFRPFPYAPFRIPWEAKITEFVWNEHLCDTLLRGPFIFWRHYHRMYPETRIGDSGKPVHGTLLRDDIEYELPFGPLGDLAHRLFITPQLNQTFDHRQHRTKALLQLIFATR